MAGRKEEEILRWLERIKRSRRSTPAFFENYRVPFSLTQFYRYCKTFEDAVIIFTLPKILRTAFLLKRFSRNDF